MKQTLPPSPYRVPAPSVHVKIFRTDACRTRLVDMLPVSRISNWFLSLNLCRVLAVGLSLLPLSGCIQTMPTTPVAQHMVNGNLLPLRFKAHDFEAKVYNTQSCRVIYNGDEFAPQPAERPTGAPQSGDYRSHWNFAFYIGIRNFPPPAQVSWVSLDGSSHEASIDIGTIFKNEQVLHKVPDGEIPADLYPQGLFLDPSIFLEVNDRTISVYMKALLPTRHLQIPGNPYSDGRDDVVLAWTHTY